MNLLTNKVTQLTELLSELIPTVDSVGRMQEKTNLELSEMRVSNIRLAVVIEKLVGRADKISDFEKRLERVEKALFR